MSAHPTPVEAPSVTVIEVRRPGGQLVERLRSESPVIRVGRAFDNELVLDDDFVSPHHLVLTRAGSGWRFEDLDSLNGVRRGQEACREGVLHSGDVISLGRTRLHVYDEQHPALPAVRMEEMEGWLAWLGSVPVVVALIALSVLETGMAQLSASVTEFKLRTVFAPLLSDLFTWVAVAAVWALVGRLLRHHGHFPAHLSLWLGMDLLDSLGSYLAQAIGYNAGDPLLEDFLSQGLALLALAFAIWGSITLASGLRSRARLYAAAGMAIAVLAFDLAERFEFDQDFTERPEYYGRIRPPGLLWATPEPESALVEALPGLFDRADQEREAKVRERDGDEPSAQPSGRP